MITQSAARVSGFPDGGCVRHLVRQPWTCVEVQSGTLRNKSARFPGAWSATALVIRSASDVFVYCESIESDSGEHFALRFVSAENSAARGQREAARPPFAAVRSWPSDMFVPPDFLVHGPTAGKIGLGPCVVPSGASNTTTATGDVPIRWCCFNDDHCALMLYVDNEIPMNVGIVTDQKSINAIVRELGAPFYRHL